MMADKTAESLPVMAKKCVEHFQWIIQIEFALSTISESAQLILLTEWSDQNKLRKIKVLLTNSAVIQRVLLPKKPKPSKKYHRDSTLRFHKQTQKHAQCVCVSANCGYYFWVWTWVLGKLCRCWVMRVPLPASVAASGRVRAQLNHKFREGECSKPIVLTSLTKA